jgi:hypothetical protein
MQDPVIAGFECPSLQGLYIDCWTPTQAAAVLHCIVSPNLQRLSVSLQQHFGDHTAQFSLEGIAYPHLTELNLDTFPTCIALRTWQELKCGSSTFFGLQSTRAGMCIDNSCRSTPHRQAIIAAKRILLRRGSDFVQGVELKKYLRTLSSAATFTNIEELWMDVNWLWNTAAFEIVSQHLDLTHLKQLVALHDGVIATFDVERSPTPRVRRPFSPPGNYLSIPNATLQTEVVVRRPYIGTDWLVLDEIGKLVLCIGGWHQSYVMHLLRVFEKLAEAPLRYPELESLTIFIANPYPEKYMPWDILNLLKRMTIQRGNGNSKLREIRVNLPVKNPPDREFFQRHGVSYIVTDNPPYTR